MSFNIAIDGPAGAGKSTIAKTLALKIGFVYVDTGALYRAIAYYFLRNSLDPENQESLKSACGDIRVELSYEGNVQKVFLNGEDVSTVIREEAVGNMASATSKYPFVRSKLLKLQQDIAAEKNVIMDGRDIGTSVLPNAQLKIFLTADVHERAVRRYNELQQKGTACSLEEIEADIKERDYRDIHRETAPLKPADDAVYLDTSDMTIEEVAEKIYSLATEAGLRN